MDSPMGFFEKLGDQITGGINNCMLGKIDKFDAETMKADVIPLVKVKYEDDTLEDMSLLIEVPVSFTKAGPFIIRPPYKKGDIILVVFTDKDNENVLLSGDISEPNSTRKHSLDDAIVVGGIMPFTKTLPGEHLEDLIIANEDFTTKVVLKENGDIIIQGNKVFLGDDEATQGVPLGDALKVWLDSHTHPGIGSPTSASPSPSKKVLVI